MLANHGNQAARRRGIVLVLVLGMLGLLALIGVTFATFSGQSRISARNFAQSAQQPRRDRADGLRPVAAHQRHRRPASAIRGHSLKRDMYGNDAANNGLPSTDRSRTATADPSTACSSHVRHRLHRRASRSTA